MENKTVISIETVIGYIEDHLSGKLDLEMLPQRLITQNIICIVYLLKQSG